MKHLKNINEENQISRKELAEQMIRIFEQKYKSHPSSFGSVSFEWEDDLRKARPGKVVSQYNDIFFILARSLKSRDLPIVEVLLGKPFDGELYTSQQDGLLQVRISGFVKIPETTNNTQRRA
jgi:hypothetical protein